MGWFKGISWRETIPWDRFFLQVFPRILGMSHLNPSWRKYRTVEAWFSCCDLLLGFIASKRIEIKNRMPCLIIRLATTCTLVASKMVPQNRAGDSRFPIKIATSLRCSPLSDNSLYWQDCKDLRSWWTKICQLRTICKRSMENQTCLNPLTPSEIVDHPLNTLIFFTSQLPVSEKPWPVRGSPNPPRGIETHCDERHTKEPVGETPDLCACVLIFADSDMYVLLCIHVYTAV